MNRDARIAGLTVLSRKMMSSRPPIWPRHSKKWGPLLWGTVFTVRDALEVIEQAERLDGAVIDIKLRSGTAFPIAEALIKRGTPFVFATGYGETPFPRSSATLLHAKNRSVRCRLPVPCSAAIMQLRHGSWVDRSRPNYQRYKPQPTNSERGLQNPRSRGLWGMASGTICGR
jgi:hypothetical protein